MSETLPPAHSDYGLGTIEVWQTDAGTWRFRWRGTGSHGPDEELRSNRYYATQEEALDAAATAYPRHDIYVLEPASESGAAPSRSRWPLAAGLLAAGAVGGLLWRHHRS